MSRTMDILRALPSEGCIHLAAIARAVKRSPDEVRPLVPILVKRRLVVRLQPGCYQVTALGRATRDTPGAETLHAGRQRRSPIPRRPKRRTIADGVWWHLRAVRGATVGELLSLLDRGTNPAAHVRGFLAALFDAGYVAINRRRRQHRYVLLENTGPATPLVDRKRRRLWDPNTKDFVAFQGHAGAGSGA